MVSSRGCLYSDGFIPQARLIMTDLSAFPVTHKWPAKYPERLQLYSLPTPNGVKVSIMLEEIGLAYEAHKVSFDNDDQLSPEFISLSANNKIPAILDPNGPGGQPLPLFESGAILQYLAEKSGQLLSQDPAQRYQTLQWLMFQMAVSGRCSARSGSSTSLPARNMKTSARGTVMSTNPSACSVCWTGI